MRVIYFFKFPRGSIRVSSVVENVESKHIIKVECHYLCSCSVEHCSICSVWVVREEHDMVLLFLLQLKSSGHMPCALHHCPHLPAEARQKTNGNQSLPYNAGGRSRVLHFLRTYSRPIRTSITHNLLGLKRLYVGICFVIELCLPKTWRGVGVG